jgi:inositol transport system permease protein
MILETKSWSLTYHKFAKKYSLLIILILFMAICSLANEHFLTPQNMINVTRQQSIVIMVALGQMMLITSGMLDLSAGAVIACAGVISIGVFKSTENMFLAILVALIVAVGANGISGVMVTLLRTPAFIATLAMQMIARGGALLYTGGQNLYQIGDYARIGRGAFRGIPYPVLIMIGFSILMFIIMRYTKFGRSIYAVGGNIEASRASGIKVNNVRIRAYLLHGVLVGVAAVVFMSRLNSGMPNGALNLEFEALTAAIVGGTSFSGGVGTVGGTIIGAFLVGFMNNIMNILTIDSYIQQMVRGTIIAAAVIWDINSTMKASKKA